MKFINDYPYTNMTAQNIDWLIKAVVDLIHEGKTDEEIKNAPGISEAYGAFCNAYPYTNMTMQNIDWLISSVRELYDKEATLEENVTKIEAQIQTLQADVANIIDTLDAKVDKTTEPAKIYGTDPNGMPFLYTQTATETTLYSVPLRNENGAIVAAAAQQGNEVVNLTQMNTALEGKVNKTTARQIVYARDSAGNDIALSYDSEATVGVAVRGQNGVLKVGTPVANDDATTKKYVNNALDNKVDKTTEPAKIYGTGPDGEPHFYEQNATEVIPWTIPFRNGTGALVAANPTLNNELTTKEYVDNAIVTAPTGGWVTILDKTWTEDESTDYVITIDIPAEYQKAMSELRMTYYNNTPKAGAVYSNKFVHIRLYDGENTLSFMYTGNILPTQDTKEVTVNFVGDTNKVSTVLGNGSSDLFNDCYGIYLYKDSNGNAVQPIPTDPNALLNTSKIIGIAEGNQETVEYVLNTCLPNRSHYYTTTSTQTTVNYTSNDYYNDQLPNCIISQILTSTDTTNLPVGSFICIERRDLIIALNISISFTSTVSVSYKNVVTRQASIVGESIQVIAGAESNQNVMTSFNDVSKNGNPLPNGYAYYSYLKNGYPTKVYIYPQSSTSNGVTATKIYAGSRLVLQARY